MAKEIGGGWVSLSSGYVIPARFQWKGRVKDTAVPDPIEVQLDIEIHDGRARAREVRVASERPLGIGRLTLRSIPIRTLMVDAVWYHLHRIELDDEGTPTRVQVSADDAGAPGIIQKLVGYIEVAP